MTAQNKLVTQPIAIPASPFWEVFRTFGRDELVAGICSVAGTGALSLFLTSNTAGERLALALAGPVVEKVGFFLGHIKDAFEVYNSTPESERKTRSYYLKRVIRGGAKSLAWDLAIHDPLYVALMMGGMYFHPATPPWLLVPIAFVVAVLIVACLQVFLEERHYRFFIYNLARKFGYEQESYLESRFYLPADLDPLEVIKDLRNHFLPGTNIAFLTYTDIYYQPALDEFNARSPQMRLRERTHGGGLLRTAQIVYTRASEHAKEERDQFRFYPQSKDKIYFLLHQTSLDEVVANKDGKYNDVFFDYVEDPQVSHTIKFRRAAIYDSRQIFIAVDTLLEAPLLTDEFSKVVEIKVYPDKAHLLKEAMRYIMHKYPVLQTTHGKYAIFTG